MNKTQKFLTYLKSDLPFFTILFFIIISLFVYLSPKTSSQLFLFKRQAVLNQFIDNTKINNKINPQEYWKLREFYSPGYFIFSRNGIEKTKLLQTKEKVGIKLNAKNIDLVFLVFSSPRADSLDMLTKQTNLNSIITGQQLSKENIIFMNKNSLIYEENPKTMKIVFLLSNTEMKKANGFFKYTENDKKITEGENWFNITSLKIN
jgi:hypothetical protein